MYVLKVLMWCPVVSLHISCHRKQFLLLHLGMYSNVLHIISISEKLPELELALLHCPASPDEARVFARATIESFASHSSDLELESTFHNHRAYIKYV